MARLRGKTINWSESVNVDLDIPVDEILEEVGSEDLVRELKRRGGVNGTFTDRILVSPWSESERADIVYFATVGNTQGLLAVVRGALQIDQGRAIRAEDFAALPRCILTRRPLIL